MRHEVPTVREERVRFSLRAARDLDLFLFVVATRLFREAHRRGRDVDDVVFDRERLDDRANRLR